MGWTFLFTFGRVSPWLICGVVVCRGITVVSAFEGYAFDAGMRVGDRLLSVDGVPVQGRSVDQVR